MRAMSASLAVVALFSLGVAPAGAADLAARQISIDATVTVGALRPLNGVQAEDAQGAAFYRAAHVDLVRIPDEAGAGDIDAIFPDMSADVENPKSYNFAPSDRTPRPAHPRPARHSTDAMRRQSRSHRRRFDAQPSLRRRLA